MATTEMRMVRWAMGVSLLEHRRNEILEEAKMEPVAMVMRRLEWFGQVKRRDETENIQSVVEIKMEGKRPRGRPKLRWKDTVRRDLKDWNIREEWATDRERWKCLYKTRYTAQGDGGEKWESKVTYKQVLLHETLITGDNMPQLNVSLYFSVFIIYHAITASHFIQTWSLFVRIIRSRQIKCHTKVEIT